MGTGEGHNIPEGTGPPIRGQRPPQFLVSEGHKIIEVSDDYVICECSLCMSLTSNKSFESYQLL